MSKVPCPGCGGYIHIAEYNQIINGKVAFMMTNRVVNLEKELGAANTQIDRLKKQVAALKKPPAAPKPKKT